MSKTRPLKNPQDEPDWDFYLDERGPAPDLRCDEEHSLWPVFGLLDRDSLSLGPIHPKEPPAA